MIVFDASTLILVAKAELLEGFLDSIAQKVAIPVEVERECCRKEKSLDAIVIAEAIRDSKIAVKRLRTKKLYQRLREDFRLGKGEAEAIALALSEKAPLVAIDDKSGINACKLLKIPFTTAVDILVRLQEKRLLAREEAKMKLEALERYGRYKSEIVADARLQLEGK